jgi:16S rRNA (guanine1207-N2)-methyltransferase
MIPNAVYGAPPLQLVSVPAEALQVSPFVPGAAALEDQADASLSSVVMLAPPGTTERRYALAQALRTLRPGGSLVVLGPKDKGGSRIGKELEGFGCAVDEQGRAHHRICHTLRPEAPTGLDRAIADGSPQFVEAIGLWSQPGLFSWDRIDPGSRQLAEALGSLGGRGADLGSGTGYLARAVLAQVKVERLDLIDLDRRAVAAARRNVEDPRAHFHWADARTEPPLADLDFVVANPPFHDGGAEDRALGQAFVRRAHTALRKGGRLWMVANRHLPYEGVLTPMFAQVELRSGQGAFKVYEARK